MKPKNCTYLGHRTALLDRNTVPEEREWLICRYRKYCNENNHEFFADSFVAYILWPEGWQPTRPRSISTLRRVCTK